MEKISAYAYIRYNFSLVYIYGVDPSDVRGGGLFLAKCHQLLKLSYSRLLTIYYRKRSRPDESTAPCAVELLTLWAAHVERVCVDGHVNDLRPRAYVVRITVVAGAQHVDVAFVLVAYHLQHEAVRGCRLQQRQDQYQGQESLDGPAGGGIERWVLAARDHLELHTVYRLPSVSPVGSLVCISSSI